jgi:hypothetical protein
MKWLEIKTRGMISQRKKVFPETYLYMHHASNAAVE